jgi:hypothetical protein
VVIEIYIVVLIFIHNEYYNDKQALVEKDESEIRLKFTDLKITDTSYSFDCCLPWIAYCSLTCPNEMVCQSICVVAVAAADVALVFAVRYMQL